MLLNKIGNKIREAQQKGVNDIIINGDFNQDFGLYEVYHEVNMIAHNQRDKTLKTGSNQIDRVCYTDGMLQYIQGCRLTDFEDVELADYRGFMFNANINSYFNATCS